MERGYCSPPVRVSLGSLPRISVSIGGARRMHASMDRVTVSAGPDIPPYTGAYEVTPSREAQLLPTAGTRPENDIVIDPIPENYGLITWNGSYIRVS